MIHTQLQIACETNPKNDRQQKLNWSTHLMFLSHRLQCLLAFNRCLFCVAFCFNYASLCLQALNFVFVDLIGKCWSRINKCVIFPQRWVCLVWFDGCLLNFDWLPFFVEGAKFLVLNWDLVFVEGVKFLVLNLDLVFVEGAKFLVLNWDFIIVRS
jgi:hypothetical protein